MAEQNLHTFDAGLPRVVLVRSASQEAQQQRGLDQTSWPELVMDKVVSGLECGIRAVWQGGVLLSVRGGCEEFLDNNDCTNDLFLRHIQSSVWIRMIECSKMVSTVQSTWLRLGKR